jgi:nucleoside-diphosphate-sugar epimerase/alpha-beta hydrolase superfamily lysophospholipase
MTDALQNVFVTGATGFIGSHIVHEFLDRTKVEIYCMVRGGSQSNLMDRLLASLQDAVRVRGKYSEIPAEWPRRLHVVPGDLSEPDLGMSAADRKMLRSAMVRELWHSGSTLMYEESDREAIERSNLGGTSALLSLAADIGVRIFNYVSTAYVAGKRNGPIEETLAVNCDDPTAFNNVYEQSKARAEHMVAKFAPAHGFHYRIFRPSIIIGDSTTFRVNSDMGFYGLLRRLHLFKLRNDRSMPGYLAEKKLKVFGDVDIPINLLPIDHFIAQVFEIVELSPVDRVHHIVNAKPPRIKDVGAIMAACLEFKAIDITRNEHEFAAIDNAFRKSYEFYTCYLSNEKTFLGGPSHKVAALPFADIEKYVLRYIEQIRGTDAEQSIFDAFSRNEVKQANVTSFDGFALTYFKTVNEKPALVLINAFGMDLEFWGPTFRYFRDLFRIITWNLRGLPDSERVVQGQDLSIPAHAKDLHRIMQAEGIENAILIGWCAGPKIALEFYRRFPKLVRALILVAGKYDSDAKPDPEITDYSKLFADLNASIAASPKIAELIVASILSASNENKARNAANTILSACSPSIEYAPYATAPFRTSQNLVTYSKLSRSYGEHDIYDMLHMVEAPTLVVAAEDDAIAHPISSTRVAEQIKTSELAVLPRASHFCLVENAGVFIHTISRYLKMHSLV